MYSNKSSTANTIQSYFSKNKLIIQFTLPLKTSQQLSRRGKLKGRRNKSSISQKIAAIMSKNIGTFTIEWDLFKQIPNYDNLKYVWSSSPFPLLFRASFLI
jgi:hypothetical protein